MCVIVYFLAFVGFSYTELYFLCRYRAVIEKVVSSSEIHVLFTDFGNVRAWAQGERRVKGSEREKGLKEWERERVRSKSLYGSQCYYSYVLVLSPPFRVVLRIPYWRIIRRKHLPQKEIAPNNEVHLIMRSCPWARASSGLRVKGKCGRSVQTTFRMESVVQGHHVYKSIWTPFVGQALSQWALNRECQEQQRSMHLISRVRLYAGCA